MIPRLLILLVAVLSANLLSLASAEQVAENKRDSVTVLDELSVSAIKQSSSLSSSAVASTLVTRADVENLNLVTLKGISDLVPNFFIPDYGSRITSSIYVRGIGARMDQPAVGLIVDNVPFLNKDAFDFDIDDIADAQVLRGPQSTLYGRDTMAGLINITTLSPLKYQGFRILAEGGSGLYFKGNLGWYHKFSPNNGLSLSAGYNRCNGFFTNEFNGKKLDKERQWSARAKYEHRLSRSFRLLNTFAASGLRQGGYPYEFLQTNSIAYNDTCFYRRFTLNDGLTLQWTHDNISVSSITSVQYINDNLTLDQDFLPLDYFTLTQKKQETGITQEFVARGNVLLRDGDTRYSYICGAFGFYKHLSMQAPVTFHDYGIGSLIEENRNHANPEYPVRWDERSFVLNSDFVMPTFGFAVYHESRLDLDRWHLAAGLRFDYEKATLDYHSYCKTGYSLNHVEPDGTESLYRSIAIEIDDTGSLAKDFVQLMPKFTALFDLPTQSPSNVYASITKGYKAGGFNTQMFSDVLQQRLMNIMGIGSKYDVADIVEYKPEKSWNYELGAHIECADGKVATDLAIFYIDCRDQQLTMFPEGNTTGRIMTNAGKTRSFGAEATVSVSLLKNFVFNVSYGYTNAKFIDFFNGVENFKGNYLPYAPQNTVFAQALYTLPLKHGSVRSLLFDVNLRATGPIYWDEANKVKQNFYGKLGASITLDARKWSLQLWGRNITDTKYHTFYFVSIGNEFVQRGNPLTFGATLRINL